MLSPANKYNGKEIITYEEIKKLRENLVAEYAAATMLSPC